MKMTNEVKSALWTFLFAFVGLFGLSALKFLADIAQWAGSNGHNPFPNVSVLGYAFISAVVAGVTGLVNFAVRFAQSKGFLPGAGPVYPTPPAPPAPANQP